jgi:hypothetical protein
MDELQLLRKKTGMTIAKAWILMVSAVILFLIGMFILGVIAALKNINPIYLIENAIFGILAIIIFLCALWGFFINKRQLPFFQKQSLFSVLVCIIIALAWSFISPIIVDFLPFNEDESNNLQRVGVHTLLGLMLSLLFTTLQIGIIGHGLLKNYLFKQVIFTVATVSIVMVIPQAVIGLFIQTLIMFYIYYKTASFQLPLLMTATLSLVEDIFKFIFGNGVATKNYIRIYLVPNEILYYLDIFACFCIIIGGLFYIKNQTKAIEWQKPQEDENIAFL